MKKSFHSLIMVSCLIIFGCSDEVAVNLDIPGADDYALLYMPQAIDGLIEKSFSITDEVHTITYSAYLGGSKTNNKNIHVTFGVLPEMIDNFNLEHGTSYEILPESAYSLDVTETVIESGSPTSGPLSVSISLMGNVEAFESYMLPIGIINTDATLNDDLKTSYFLITGSYAPGEVPRELVYQFEGDPGKIMFDFHGNLVHRAPNGALLLYPAEEDGTFSNPRQIGEGWHIFDMVFFYNESRIIGRWIDSGNITQYYVDENGNFGASGTVGFGWHIFPHIIPFKGILLGVHGNGVMTMYPLGEWDFNWGGIRDIGSGWHFPAIIPYQNSLLAIGQNGNMTQYQLSDEGNFGSSKSVGSGWDQYRLVFSSGTDLLALDDGGNLWRYRFNPAGFWPLR